MAFQLTREQRAAVDQRGGGLLVSAAAGSGKTRVLVERLLERVEEGADIDRFLVITYTKAAAAELRGRIAAELSDRLSLRPGDAYLRRQATLVYKAGISTIDAFCTRFLREEGHRLDLDHDFRVCDENEALVLMEEALGEVLEERYEGVVPGDDFSLLVDTMSDGRDDSKLQQMVMDVRGRVQSHPDPAGWIREQERVFALEGVADAGDTPWGQVLLADVRRQSGYWAGRMLECLDLCQGDGVLMKAYAPSLQATFNGLMALSAATQSGWDASVDKAGALGFPKLGSSRGCGDQEALERIKGLRDRCKKRAEKLKALLSDDSEGLLSDMRAVYPAVRGLFALVRDFEERYAAMKRKRSLLDFSDLEHFTARLLVGPDGRPTSLANRWGERYDEVMVDEFQDVNAVQNAIFTALSAEGRNLFTVGDVKQSIYRFRLADPAIFLEKYRAFKPWEEAEEGESRKALLSRNFRSRPQVLEGCNYVFRSIMSVPFGEMDYTDAEALVPGGQFSSPEGEDPYALELDLLDCSGAREEDEGGQKLPKDLLEARFAAKRIRSLLDGGFPVSDGEGGLRPVTTGDVVILLRSPGTVLPHYAAALEEAGLSWEADGAGDFFAAEEVQVALSFLRLIDNFHQDVPLIAALRSPVCGFSADRLAQIRGGAPGADFYTALTGDQGEDVKVFLDEINDLRQRAGDESCDRLIWRLYGRTNLLGLYAGLEDGEARRGNLLLLAQLARDFEAAGHRGLYGFLGYLQRLEEAGKGPAMPKAGVGSGVRIMSIHRSKGLEFPVVLLCGLAHQPNRMDARRPMLFHPGLGVGPKRLDLERMIEYPTLARLAVTRKLEQEQGAEELRLLYVAMTRAKEKLILSCALTKGRGDIEKLEPLAGTPVEPQALLDSQSPAQWVLLAALARPEAKALRGGQLPPAVRPGTEFGPKWDIKWADGADYAVAPSPAAERVQVVGEKKENVEALAERFRWVYPHEGDSVLPSKLTATQLKGRDLDGEASEEAPQPSRPVQFRRPRFAGEKLGLTPAERGTALHLVMQYIDFDACRSAADVGTEIGRLAEEEFITPQQAQAVEPEKVWGFFNSPLGRETVASPTLRREFKFSILVPARQYWPQAGEGETVLLQGVVDCYFETDEGITVIDFKTDNVRGEALTARAAEYKPQLEAYAQALGEITGRPVVRRALWFFSEGKAVEV